eukprot:scaffold1741_cov262-Pinguiococcus_pyrenoidosus.AAC.28
MRLTHMKSNAAPGPVALGTESSSVLIKVNVAAHIACFLALGGKQASRGKAHARGVSPQHVPQKKSVARFNILQSSTQFMPEGAPPRPWYWCSAAGRFHSSTSSLCCRHIHAHEMYFEFFCTAREGRRGSSFSRRPKRAAVALRVFVRRS